MLELIQQILYYLPLPSQQVSLHCNNILMNHYPERLGLAICYHAPTLFSMTWRVRKRLERSDNNMVLG
jgi:hypothetical protein